MNVFILYTTDVGSFVVVKVVDSLEKALNWKKQVQSLLDKYYEIYELREKEKDAFYKAHNGNTKSTNDMWYQSATYIAFTKELEIIEKMLEQYDTNAYNSKCGYYEYPVE